MENTAVTLTTSNPYQLSDSDIIQLEYIKKILEANSKDIEALFPLVTKRNEIKKVKKKKAQTIEILEIHGAFSGNLFWTISELETLGKCEIHATFKNDLTFCIRVERPVIHVL